MNDISFFEFEDSSTDKKFHNAKNYSQQDFSFNLLM